MSAIFKKGVEAYEHKAYSEAYEHFREAADQESVDAMANLALMHMKGIGCSTDINKTKFWLEKAASKGHARSMMSLAQMYEKGMDGTIDTEKALEYYTQAANLGIVEAQLKSGILFREKGEISKAMQYLISAAHNNNQQAQEMITYVSNAGIDGSCNTLFRSLDIARQKELVENVIKTKILPTLEADNGGIELVNYVPGDIPQIWLNYLGACSGCHLGSTSTADMLLDHFETLIDKNVVIYLM